MYDSHELGRIAKALEAIEHLLRHALRPQVTDFQLYQKLTEEDFVMPILGTTAGATSTFNIQFVPATGFVPLQSGPTVTVDDATVTLTPVDGSNNFTASVPASSTAASYNLTVAGVNGAGTAITHSFNIPILPAAPVQVTDFSLSQVS